MAKMTTEEILGVFEEMSVLELKEFLDAFEAVSYTHLTLPTTPYV